MRTFTTRDGSPWTPKYLTAIDAELCIGCGRCFKVCTQGVLKLMGINEDGDFCDPFDDDDGEVERKVMVLDKDGACIGCSSCAAVCGTKAQSHEALAA
ncbi:MAG: ferredoxin III, nif-specific [Actinomycetota bacterium]